MFCTFILWNICQLCWISEGGVDESFWAVCVCTMEGHKTRRDSYITINLAPFLICVLLPSQSLLALHNRIFWHAKDWTKCFQPPSFDLTGLHIIWLIPLCCCRTFKCTALWMSVQHIGIYVLPSIQQPLKDLNALHTSSEWSTLGYALVRW